MWRGWQADNLRCGMVEVRGFKGLKVWERSHRLVLGVYNAIGEFPREETYGLTAQLRRCTVSIPANIADGCGRSGEAELGRSMIVAMGSASELEYHLLLARDLGYLGAQDYQELSRETGEVKRMLSTLITKMRHTKKLIS
jgi:four helix bundle protein